MEAGTIDTSGKTDFVVTNDTGAFASTIIPEYSDWQCELFGSGHSGTTYRPHKGQEPCWFWRQMQYLCFGCKWKENPQ